MADRDKREVVQEVSSAEESTWSPAKAGAEVAVAEMATAATEAVAICLGAVGCMRLRFLPEQ